jgi:hypothetical protein
MYGTWEYKKRNGIEHSKHSKQQKSLHLLSLIPGRASSFMFLRAHIQHNAERSDALGPESVVGL